LLAGLDNSSCKRFAEGNGLRLTLGLPSRLPIACPAVLARFLLALEVGIEAFDAPVPLGGLFDGVPLAGVSGLKRRLEAYGSAVCGRGMSGLLGRRTGPDMRELPFAPVDAPLEDADVAVEAFDATLLLSALNFDGPRPALPSSGFDFEGDRVAMAELGRSGRFLAALLARLCSAINSFKVERPDCAGFELGPEAARDCDAWREAFGLFGSFSRRVLDFASSLFMMPSAFSGHVLAKIQYVALIPSLTFGLASSRPFLIHLSARSSPPDDSKWAL